MDVYKEIINLQIQNLPGVIVTVISKSGHGPQVPGAKMLITKNKTFGTIGGGALEHIAIDEYDKVINRQECYTKKYMLGENNNIIDAVETGMICGGEISLFYECIRTNPSVYIFGAGHVGKAIVHFLRELDYKVTVIDPRENINFEQGDKIEFINKDCMDFIERTEDIENSFVVITTHSHELDYNVLKKVYESKCEPKYIGLIASKKKSDTIVKRLADELEGKPDLNILYSPIGLKLGGNTPADIGLSIVSEIQALNFKIEGNKHASKNWKEVFKLVK
jgi:xanthine dehydrogenase accessory factor